jgi:hypothetical protein
MRMWIIPSQVIDRSVTARNSALTKISNTIDAWQYQVGSQLC